MNIQYVLDGNENFELLRDVAEHNAMFMNPEGVSQIREARKNTYKVDDKDFSKLIKEEFGKDVNFDASKAVVSEQQIVTNKFLDLELDEVSFTPYK